MTCMNMKLLRDTRLDNIPEVPAVYKLVYPNGVIKVGRTKNLRHRLERYIWEDLKREKYTFIKFVSYKESHNLLIDERKLITKTAKQHANVQGYKEWFLK